jgi:SPP1 family predicted phage head-tail adaptor
VGLNNRVTIRQRSGTTDAAGQPSRTFVDLVSVWADVRHPSGVEQLRGEAPVSVVRASIKVRLRSDITAAMQAVHAGVTYDIKAVLPDRQDRRFMFLTCEAAK